MAINLLPNSSMEPGTPAIVPASLTTCTAAFSTLHVMSGARALMITLTGTTFSASWAGASAQLAMSATVTAAVAYSISAWVFCTTAAQSINMGIAFFDATGTSFKNSAGGVDVSLAANTWTRISTLNTTAGAGSGVAAVSFGTSTTDTSGAVFWIDQLQLEASATISTWNPGPGDPPVLLPRLRRQNVGAARGRRAGIW